MKIKILRKGSIEAIFDADTCTFTVRQYAVGVHRLDPTGPITVQEKETGWTDGFHPIIEKTYTQTFSPIFGRDVVVQAKVAVVRAPWGDRIRGINSLEVLQDEGPLSDGFWKTRGLIAALKSHV